MGEQVLDRAAVSAVDSTSQFSEALDLGTHLRDALWRVDSAGIAPGVATGGLVIAGMGGSGVGALLALGWLVPPLAALAGSRVGAVGYAAGVAGRVVAGRRTGARVWPDALAHPVSVAALLALTASSWRGRRSGALRWKGRPV